MVEDRNRFPVLSLNSRAPARLDWNSGSSVAAASGSPQPDDNSWDNKPGNSVAAPGIARHLPAVDHCFAVEHTALWLAALNSPRARRVASPHPGAGSAWRLALSPPLVLSAGSRSVMDYSGSSAPVVSPPALVAE